MKHRTPNSPLCAALLGLALCALPLRATVLLSDNFATNPKAGAIWTVPFVEKSTSTTGLTKPASGAPALSLVVDIISHSHRATLISKQSNIDPFAAPITVAVSGLKIGGTPSIGTTKVNGGGNAFYALIGNTDGARDSDGILNPAKGQGSFYFPGHSATTAGYLAVSIISRVDLEKQPFAQLVIDDRGVSNYSSAYTVSGIPTGMKLTIDGKNQSWSVELEGAFFVGNQSSFLSGSLANFTAESVRAGSYLALGAINATGAVEAGTTVSLQSVSVTSGAKR
jgi:hypothetical protein